jgi:hypothetical protein
MFIRQPRSKAVSIINLDSGEARPAVAQHNQPATTFPVSFRPTMNNVHFPALPSANKKTNPVSATKGVAMNSISMRVLSSLKLSPS